MDKSESTRFPLYSRLEDSWQGFSRRWDSTLAEAYGKEYVAPMKEALLEYEESAALLLDAALELDNALRTFARQEGEYV